MATNPNITAGYYEVVTALSAMNLKLSDKLYLTDSLAAFKKDRVKNLSVQAAVDGTNQVTTVTAGTAVVGDTYSITITSTFAPGGFPLVKTYKVVATATSSSTLGGAFRTLMQADGVKVPWTVTGSTTGIIITATPVDDLITGEVPFTVGLDASGVLTQAATTPNVRPIGQGAQLLRIKNKCSASGHQAGNGVTFIGTPATGSKYTTVTVQVRDEQGDKIRFFVVYLLESQTYITYIKSVVSNFAANLGFGVGTPVALIPVTSAAGTGVVNDLIPFGISVGAIVSAANSDLIFLTPSMPVGTQILLTEAVNGFTLVPAATESINGGTPSGTVTIGLYWGAAKSVVDVNSTDKMNCKLTKCSATDWTAVLTDSDGDEVDVAASA